MKLEPCATSAECYWPRKVDRMIGIRGRTTQLYFSACLAILCLCAAPLQAQSAETTQGNPALITSMTIESFQQRVQALGFSTTRGSKDGKQNSFFTFMAEGRKVGGLTLGPKVIELFVSYSEGATLEDLNEWNSTHWGTAFIAQNGNAVLKSDLALESGVTEQNVSSFVASFRDVAGAYARFIVDHKKKP